MKKCASELVTTYPADIEESFVSEFLEFIDLIREGDMVTSVAHMNGLLRAHGGMLLSTFPNVGIALMLYLTLPWSPTFTKIHFLRWQESKITAHQWVRPG